MQNNGNNNNRNNNKRPSGNRGPNRNNRNNNRRRHHHGKRFHKKPLSAEKVILKYDNLLDQHLQARRKYFEMYYRVDFPALDKLEHNFYETMLNLRRFEERLLDWQREALEKKINGYKLDRHYTEMNKIPPQGDPVPSGPFKNPHVTDNQINRQDYSHDKQESSGSMDDYLKYKESTGN